MRKIDVDGHFMEPFDWLESSAPDLASKIPPVPLLDILAEAVAGDALSILPKSHCPDPLDLFPEGFRTILQQILKASEGRDAHETQALLEEWGFSAPVNYEAEARLAVLDQQGIEKQFLLATSGINPYKTAKRSGQPELALPCLEAYNSWALGQVAGHTDRLMPVVLIDLEDMDWAERELRRVHKAGARVFQLRTEPVDHRSLAHTDFDEFWSLAEDLEMALAFHTASARTQIHPSWINDGVDPRHFGPLFRRAGCLLPQLAVAALISNGVLERHPKLPVFVLELGTSWVPHWLEDMDSVASSEFGYQLDMKPSEYVQRQVRVSSLIKEEPWRSSFEHSPEDVIVFSTDFPHPEGALNAEDLYLEQMKDVDERRKERFFAGAVADLLPCLAA